MSITNSAILQVLSTVNDPDLKKDLVSLNMVKDIVVSDEKVSFTVVLTTPACPLKEKIKNDCLEAVKKVVGDKVAINILMTSSVTTLRDNAPLLPGVKNIIAIASGKGGVGKSTVTTNLAVALALSGAKVGLIDADIFGPSIPVMFNCEREQPEVKVVNGKNLIMPLEQYGVKLMSIGFLAPPESAVVWRGPMASSALKQFIGDTIWGDLDYLLIDLPPGTSDIHLTLVQTVPVTGAIIVTTPQKVALADAVKGLAMFKQPSINVPVLGVIENMAYFTPEELPDNKYFIFGKDGGKNLAEKFNVPFLGQIPLVQSIRESGDSGLPAVMKGGTAALAFTHLAESLARQVAIRNATFDTTKKVELTV
ncbi:MAG: Mrp/NBP35 family ATP-binding protein [Cytophagales bacterium]|nr:Mrp/NBP35 family ATP-binding protein [Cytophagales bacterium]MCA6366516.1 Mrp/NBP35 family ATP-binding protein [Cytophagales bacterium]MCA6372640.1 Mrp/NBP35 family ATP-binding protein [Cytophagales bacterium]MCA6376856.1 Mrp/NBP35 family ATP-binding protein [Cytophagales bacterium]MCA6383858.1 Mrp/NBP35 family ATP-binding protein [Cytophagales bacterium]